MQVTVVQPFVFGEESDLSPVGRVFVDADAQRISDNPEWHRHVVFTDRTPFVVADPTPQSPPPAVKQPAPAPLSTSPAPSAKEQ